MTEVNKQIFANHFWGLKDEGYYALTSKMNSNKKTCDEIKSFYNVRASLHEEFGRKLMKHAKNIIGREETGTVHTLLKSAQEEMERNAQAHIELGYKLKSVLEVYLDNFILEQKDKKKLTHTSVEKARRYKQSSETYLLKVKEKYESDCAKLITLQTQIGSVSGRGIEKIKQKIEKTQQDIRFQEQEYKTASKKLANATGAWNGTWKSACDTYQVMEKQRLEFLHHSFSMYINMLSTATNEDQESHERFWKSLDAYDPRKDIESFISDKGTGSKIPVAEVFIDYMDDPSKAMPQYTIANFPTPPELNISDSPVIVQEFPGLESKNENFIAYIDPNPDGTLKETSINATQKIPVQKPLPPILKTRMKQKPKKDSSMDKPTRTPQSQEKCLIEDVKQELPYSPQQRQQTLQQNTLQCKQSTPLQHADSAQMRPMSRKKTKKQQQDPLLKNKLIQQSVPHQSSIQQQQDPLLKNKSIQQSVPHQSSIQQQQERSVQPLEPYPSAQSHLQAGNEPLSVLKIEQEKHLIDTQVTIPIVTPTISPTLATCSTADTSDDDHEVKGDAAIDPRANVVLAIGNNMFHLGHLDVETYDMGARKSKRRVPLPDLEAACNFSYQSLLQEIGVNHSSPPTITSSTHSILFWAFTLADWHSGKTKELQFSKGTWLAVIEVRPNGWYQAIKFDSRVNQLTNEIGSVAQNIVKVCL